MEKSDTILVLFSGGVDSTLAAVIAAKRTKTIYLITYERFGLFGSEKAQYSIKRLKKKFPDVEFIHKIENIEKEYKKISCYNRISDMIKYGFATLTVCGFCKLAMHWKTMKLCKIYGVKIVYDGAIKATKVFPAQNKEIMINEMLKTYKEQGIDYKTPVYDMDTERMLYQEGLIASSKVKGTYKDIQPTCSQQLLFSRVVNYYLSKFSFEEYQEILKRFYSKKIGYLRRQLTNA